ncbi:MAG: hypothetical protein JWO03_2825 [Bacteroidetes bacterium]|nr:hypothetical protein [Bacteroidota bacterium]
MNKKYTLFVITLMMLLSFTLPAQQRVGVISRCGGTDSVTIPAIVDNDLDGMDDRLEGKLLDRFMPVIMQFSGETCPGPALDGTGDSNLVVCHIYPLPGQYSIGAISPDSIRVHPIALVGDTGLVTGMIWYDPVIIVHCALLYGKDCGLNGHTADVEGFSFTLRYTGSNAASGWMYDTILSNWQAVKIQTVSHANTICEQIEVFPYRSVLFPAGKDTVFASPNKHGNYLTISQCGASFICNPACSGTLSPKAIRIVNIGERNASLVPDLGTYYAAYAGEDPWSSSDFLGGNAGTVGHVTEDQLSATFDVGHRLDTASQICDLYRSCYSCGDSIYDACITSGSGVVSGTVGFSPWYHCGQTYTTGAVTILADDGPYIYPVPAHKQVQIVYQTPKGVMTATIYDSKGALLKKTSLKASSNVIDISELSAGIYVIQLTSGRETFYRKLLVD